MSSDFCIRFGINPCMYCKQSGQKLSHMPLACWLEYYQNELGLRKIVNDQIAKEYIVEHIGVKFPYYPEAHRYYCRMALKLLWPQYCDLYDKLLVLV